MNNGAAGIKGFTLLEIMLVMVILAGLATLVVSRAPADNSRQEGERLAWSIRQVAERAELENKIYALAVFTNGLQLKVLSRQALHGEASKSWPGYYWHQARLMKKYPMFSLPQHMRLSLRIENKSFELQAMENNTQPPQLVFFPDGEIIDFTLGIYAKGKLTGRITIHNGSMAFIPFAENAL
ncbi:type II secretion system protein [Erwinia sp. BNK-24-b]|uniref:type II secretion system protein n=1 Tax=unclassified Erwinia TaxID=2622719 RepID=UPI0039BEDA8C